MAKLNQGLSIKHSFQFIWQNVCGYLKTTDVSTSTFFYIKKTIINQIINQVLIDYESLGCLLAELPRARSARAAEHHG